MSEFYEGCAAVTEGLSSLKVGDAILHLVPQGLQLERCQRVGLPAVFGCVDLVNPPYMEQPEVTLWSTLFAFYQKDFGSDEQRTFTPDTTQLFEVERAETHIPLASGGQFSYGEPARMIHTEGVVDIIVDSYFDGIVSGLDPEGMRASGGASYFVPTKDIR
jgi:hypothetical protein